MENNQKMNETEEGGVEYDLYGIKKRYIDWEQTGNKLFRLRSDNANLRRYVCSKLRRNKGECNGNDDCIHCSDATMDHNISRPELAGAFNVSEGVIYNWETGRSVIGLEDLLFYCQIARVNLEDIIVYQE